MILRLMGEGLTTSATADKLGLSRKTISRWRASLAGFDEACTNVSGWARLDTPSARAEIDRVVASWTPGGLVLHELPGEIDDRARQRAAGGLVVESDPVPARGVEPVVRVEPEIVVAAPVAGERDVAERPPQAEPEVLSRDGRLVVRHLVGESSTPPGAAAIGEGHTGLRPPTPAEWLAKLAAIAENQEEPPQVRVVAMGCVSSALFGGPHTKPTRQSESTPSPAAEAAEREAREKGRDAGVPASFWQDARMKFLGPAPQPAGVEVGKDEGEPVPAESSSA